MKRFLVLLFASLGLLLAGCGGGSTPAISISASSSASTVEAGGTAQITATVSNDSSNKGVTWAVACSAAPCGSVSPTSSATSPFTTTYTAPTTPPSSALTVTVTATSISDSTKSGSATISVPAVSISVSPSTVQVAANGTQQFVATVTGVPNTDVSWALYKDTTSCSPTCGTLSNATSTTVTYTGPATPLSKDLILTLTATAAADSTKSASATITVPALTVSVSPPAVTVLVNTTYNFTATVTNDPSSAGVKWSLTQAGTACSPTCGSLSNVTLTSITYTAPAALPTSPTVVLTATSLANGTSQASATITLTTSVAATCGSGSESELYGRYAFQIQGFNTSGFFPTPFGIIGSFVADGSGNISEGVMDVNEASGLHTEVSLDTMNSSYSVGSDNRGCLTITSPSLTSDFRFSLSSFTSGVAGEGRMIEFDSDSTHRLGSGVIEQQNPSTFTAAHLTGTYAFGMSGFGTVTQRLGMVGTVAISPPNATFTEDINFAGNLDNTGTNVWPATPLSYTATVSDLSSDGRTVLTINLSPTTQAQSVAYVVSDQKVLLMSMDPLPAPLLAGMAMRQSGGPFANGSLSTNVVFYGTGVTPGATPPTTGIIAGIMAPSGTGNVSILQDYNDGTSTNQQSLASTYTVASNGRVMTSYGGAVQAISYLVSPDKGFFLNKNNEVMAGFFEPQTGAPFTNGSFSGSYSYGSLAPNLPPAQNEAGVVSADGAGTLSSWTSDTDSIEYGLSTDTFTDIPYSISANGRGTVSGAIIYVISPSKAVILETDPGTPTLRIVNKQ